MARVCTICANPKRAAIDEALTLGQRSYRDVARQYGSTKDAMARHHHAHVSPALIRVAERLEEHADRRGAMSLLDRIQALAKRTEGLLEKAEQSGSVVQALAAVRELRGMYELVGRATGELKSNGEVNVQVLNVTTSGEWLRI